MLVSEIVELLRRFPHDAEVVPINDCDHEYLIDMTQSSAARQIEESGDDLLCYLDVPDAELPGVLRRAARQASV